MSVYLNKPIKKISVALLALLLAAAAGFFPVGAPAPAHAEDVANSAFLDRWNKLHAALDDNQRSAVRALRDEIQGLSDDVVKGLLEDIFEALEVKSGDEAGFVNAFKDFTSLFYDPQASTIANAWNTHKTLLTTYMPDLTLNGLLDFLMKWEEEILGEIAAYIEDNKWLELYNFMRDPAQRSQLMGRTLDNVVAVNPDNVVSDIISSSNLKTPIVNLMTSLQITLHNDDEAFIALAQAYLNIMRQPGGGGTTPTPPPADQTPPPPPPAPPVEPLPSLDDLFDEIERVGEIIESLPPEEVAQKIEELIYTAVATIQNINVFDESMKTVSDGTVTVTVSGGQILETINQIAQIKQNLEQLIEEAGVEIETPQVVLTVEIGDVEETNLDVKLPAEIVQAAQEAGLAGLEIKSDVITATIPVGGQFSGDVDFKVGTRDTTEVNVETNLRVAAKVYELAVDIDGEPVTEFDPPILLRIPISLAGNVDVDLLSVAKIVDGGFIFYGGYVEGNEIVEARESLSTYTVVENKVAFNDTAGVRSWAGRAIEVMAAKGAIEGRGGGVFDPGTSVTRAEFAKMLVKALDLESAKATTNFADVKSTDWFAPYVASAVKHGIIQGRSAQIFDPHAKITRAEMATMIARALKVKQNVKAPADLDGALSDFADADDIHASLREGVAIAADKGLIVGYDGKFHPNDNATRAQAAVVLYRTFQYRP